MSETKEKQNSNSEYEDPLLTADTKASMDDVSDASSEKASQKG